MKKSPVIVLVLIVALFCFSGCSLLGASNKASLESHDEEAEEIEIMDEIKAIYERSFEDFHEKYAEEIETNNNEVSDEEYYEQNEETEVEEPIEYVLMGLREGRYIPTLTFYENEKEFSFLFDNFSDDILEGNYTIIGNTLTATTYDDKFHYTFEVMDETSLKFIAEESSEITLTHKDLGFEVEDRTVFKLKK